jgi:hypothetical protein
MFCIVPDFGVETTFGIVSEMVGGDKDVHVYRTEKLGNRETERL